MSLMTFPLECGMKCICIFLSLNFHSSGDVPFFVPPRFKRAPQPNEEKEEREYAEEWDLHPDLNTQRGSVTVGSMSGGLEGIRH